MWLSPLRRFCSAKPAPIPKELWFRKNKKGDFRKAKAVVIIMNRKSFKGYTRGIGLGGWLTNYKRIGQLPEDRRMLLTVGDFEHFENYITEWDVENIA